MRILIICTGNSCRSQMAEGFIRSIAPKSWLIFSAGIRPEQAVNPIAIRVMAEIGIDISTQRPKSVEAFVSDSFDFLITVCGGANENCPTFTGKVRKHLHIGFPDPASAVGSDEEILNTYRQVRDDIIKALREFFDSINKNKVFS